MFKHFKGKYESSFKDEARAAVKLFANPPTKHWFAYLVQNLHPIFVYNSGANNVSANTGIAKNSLFTSVKVENIKGLIGEYL